MHLSKPSTLSYTRLFWFCCVILECTEVVRVPSAREGVWVRTGSEQRRFTIPRHLIGFFMGDSSSPINKPLDLDSRFLSIPIVLPRFRFRLTSRLLIPILINLSNLLIPNRRRAAAVNRPFIPAVDTTLGSYVYINLEIPEAIPMAAEFVARDNQNPILKIQYQKSKDEAAEKQRNRLTLTVLYMNNILKTNGHGGA
ncbi:hypothetical protein LXL04_025908 [Taraxacum kok-saghyz]